MNTNEFSAKTVDEAIANALSMLGTTRENVDIEIVSEGSKGLFGLGSKDAKVIVTIKEVIKAESPKNKATSDSVSLAKQFVQQLISKMKLNCNVSASEDADAIKVIVTGDDVGTIIGRRGETLDSIQYLINLHVNKDRHGDDYKRIILDTENYRAKREETLVRLANSMASKVVKYRKDMLLEPMNPYERRIIHASLQDHRYVTTRSVGEEPNRKIVVTLKK